MQVRTPGEPAQERVCACTLERAGREWTVHVVTAAGHEKYQGRERGRMTQPLLVNDALATRVVGGGPEESVTLQVFRFADGGWRVLVRQGGLERVVEAVSAPDILGVHAAILDRVGRSRSDAVGRRSTPADSAALAAMSPTRRWLRARLRPPPGDS